MTEEWRDIPGWEGHYQISDHGRVRSKTRTVRKRVFSGAAMQTHAHKAGYKVVWLRRDGHVHKKYFVHRLVGIAFLPNPLLLPVVNHLDGVRENAALRHPDGIVRLEWATQSQNITHGYMRRKEPEMAEDIPF